MISIGYVSRVSHAAWDSWLTELSPLWAGKRSAAFEASRHAFGYLPAYLAENLEAAIRAAPVGLLEAEDYAEGSIPASYKDTEIEELNRRNVWHALDGPTDDTLFQALVYLREPIERVLGCPWRVLNVRSWTALPQSGGAGPYGWHFDGLPKGILKLMIYSTPTPDGALEVDAGGETTNRLGGAAGLWVLLYNSTLRHRGLPPKSGDRIATEVTLCPWPVSRLEPLSLGMNGAIPVFPV